MVPLSSLADEQMQLYAKLREISKKYKGLKLLLEAVRQIAQSRPGGEGEEEELLSPAYPKSSRGRRTSMRHL